MRTVNARVVKGKVITRAKLPEGAKLTVVVHDTETDVELDEADEAVIARSIADLRDGKFVTGPVARAYLRRK